MSAAREFLARRSRRAPVKGLVAEIAISVAIVASFWLVGSAAYASYARGTARVEAQALLAKAAERQAAFRADRGRYADSLTVLDLAVPARLDGKYAVAVTAEDGVVPAFVITATATGRQAGDKCASMTIDQSGRRDPPACW
jgi:type IV pilus assembly protein PilE